MRGNAMKVVCTGCKTTERAFTVGRVYTWENNALTCDSGYTFTSMVDGTDPAQWALSDFYTFSKVF